MQVSVTIISRNEESRIRQALQSVRWAAERIVVDCGSTDRTVELATQEGARVVHHEFVDFASQKNFAHSMASHDWILNLDADELCTPELASEIAALPETAALVYEASRKNFFQNRWIRHCGWYPDYKVRLYNRSAAHWEGKVHESLKFDGEIGTARLRGHLLHYTYKGFDRYMGSVHQFSRMAAEQYYAEGRTTSILGLLFRPPVAFIKKYFLQLGIADGYPGF
ncbi:MAG TPA: glycosyltransferase family 2 protein, partial [Acidobacteriota bacterium]|nr:glycosyltransferase family 2 protein [Acidobacteriota bacterium]